MWFWIISWWITLQKQLTTKPFSPNQYTPAPAECVGVPGEVGRLEAALDHLCPQLPPHQNIKKKNRKDNLPHILLLFGCWIPEQEEGFNLAFGEIKCHYLKRKKKSQFHC